MPKRIEIVIDLDNDVFEQSPYFEVGRIVSKYATDCATHDELLDATLFDVNGNTVGHAKIIED